MISILIMRVVFAAIWAAVVTGLLIAASGDSEDFDRISGDW